MMLIVFLTIACTTTEADPELYYQQAQQVIDTQCMNCHGKGVAAGQLDLTIGLCSSTRGITANNYDGLLVSPHQIESSILWHKVAGTGLYGANMPDDQALEAADLAIIEQWIENGALCPNEIHNPAETEAISQCANPETASQDNINVENGQQVHNDVCLYCHANASSPQLEVIIPANSDDRIQEIICKDSGFVDELTGGISQQDFYDVLYVLRDLYPEAPLDPLIIAGNYTDGDVIHTITTEQWMYINQAGTLYFDITMVNNDERYVIAQNRSTNSANPDKWSRFDWVFAQEDLYYCQVSTQDETAQSAQDNNNADAANLSSGCNQQAWRLLIPQ